MLFPPQAAGPHCSVLISPSTFGMVYIDLHTLRIVMLVETEVVGIECKSCCGNRDEGSVDFRDVHVAE